MRKLSWILLIAMLLLWQSVPGFAGNDTWVDKKFDFKSVTGIYLEEPQYDQKNLEDVTQLQLRDAIFDGGDKLKGVEALTDEDMKKKLLRYFEVDYDALAAKNPEEAEAAWNRGVASFTQLWIQPVIQRYEVEKTWKEPYTYTTTEYEDITVTKDGKQTKIRLPKTVEHYVPGHNVYTGYVKVKFDVFSTKEGRLVFSYVDSRSAEKECWDMYKRIVDSFYGKLKKRLKSA